MTSAYLSWRPRPRLFVCLLFERETIVPENGIFLFKERELISIVMSTNDSSIGITFSRQGLTKTERESGVS